MSRKTYRIKFCWGMESGECPNLIQPDPDLRLNLEQVVEDSGWPELLTRALSGDINPLSQFSISVSGCPNGCSRPQIADIGLIQAQQPVAVEDGCTACGECLQVCREGAITLDRERIGLDPQKCLACAACLRVCPAAGLTVQAQGYRIQVGGKLGRHPRLAEELPGIFSRERVLEVLDNCLGLHQGHYRPGLRFGQVVSEQGISGLLPGPDA